MKGIALASSTILAASLIVLASLSLLRVDPRQALGIWGSNMIPLLARYSAFSMSFSTLAYFFLGITRVLFRTKRISPLSLAGRAVLAFLGSLPAVLFAALSVLRG
ncbi:MAG TPA: hypothetical protein VIO60_04710 [Rectinemataceae bacterium]